MTKKSIHQTDRSKTGCLKMSSVDCSNNSCMRCQYKMQWISMTTQGSPIKREPLHFIMTWNIVHAGCYDHLLRGYLFSPMPFLLSYASFRTLSISGGLVRFLSWSPALFSCALSLGHPYPCSPPAFLLLSGVGSIVDCRLVHCLCVIPADSFISSR